MFMHEYLFKKVILNYFLNYCSNHHFSIISDWFPEREISQVFKELRYRAKYFI